jgi:hypothetical protein
MDRESGMRAMIGAALFAVFTLLAGTLLASCAARTDSAAAGPGEPGSISTHINGRLNFYTGVGSGS